jgi:hypothetical protein
MIRGLIYPEIHFLAGMKIGDIDQCHFASDQDMAPGGRVLEFLSGRTDIRQG